MKEAAIYDDVNPTSGCKTGLNDAGANALDGRNLISNFWMKATVDGFIALADGEPNAAAQTWLGAGCPSGQSEALRAASHNNVGIAHLMGSRFGEAAYHLTQAGELWSQVSARVPGLDVSIGGRSSAFHLRLAMDHPEALAELRRRRYADLCAAGEAIVRWNAVHASAVANGPTDTSEELDLITLLATAFGAGCTEVQLLRERSATLSASIEAAYRSKAVLLERRFADAHARAGGDEADIEIAAHLTALLHPSLLTASSTERR